MLGSAMAWCLYFLTYSKVKDYLKARSGRADLRQVEIALSGMSCSCAVLVFTNPIWLIKTRMQLQSKKTRYKSGFDALKRIVREEGAMTFFRGIGPALTLSSTGTIQLIVYENLRRLAVRFNSRGRSEASKAGGIKTYTTTIMGGLSKAVATISTYPLLLVKARLYQKAEGPTPTATRDAVLRDRVEGGTKDKLKYKNIRDILSRVFRQDGLRGFYRGMGPHLAKTIPSSAITFTTYEFLIKQAGSRW